MWTDQGLRLINALMFLCYASVMPMRSISPSERTRAIWRGMKKRCLDSTDTRWKDYGGRGITVDPTWLDFQVFLRDMGIAPPEMSIERRNNNQGYSKRNCKWATRIEQQNNMRTNRRIRFDDRIQTLSQWSREFGLDPSTLNRRLAVMPLAEAMQAGPIQQQRRASVDLVITCPWCSYKRARTRGGEFCYKCRINAEGLKYNLQYARSKGVKPKHRMALEPWEIAKYQGVSKQCAGCKETKDVLEGFGLRRPFDPRSGRTNTLPRVYCKTCDGRKNYQRALRRKF